MACFSLDEMEGLSERQGRSVGVPDMGKSLYEDSFELGSSLHLPTNCVISFYFTPLHLFSFFFSSSFSFHVVVVVLFIILFFFFYGVQEHVL